ncbi:MAG: class II aldolase/adducin family protein [Anaerovoracaceae bacterium]
MSIKERQSIKKQEVLQAASRLYELGLVDDIWGNISSRIDEYTFAITASGIPYDDLSEDKIIIVDSRTLEYEGEVKPSSEKAIHAVAYNKLPKVNFIAHTHQSFATAVASAGFVLSDTFKTMDKDSSDSLFNDKKRQEAKAIIEGIDRVKYVTPGTKELAEKVEEKLDIHTQLLFLENHGTLLLGKDKEEVIKLAIELEDLCKNCL